MTLVARDRCLGLLLLSSLLSCGGRQVVNSATGGADAAIDVGAGSGGLDSGGLCCPRSERAGCECTRPGGWAPTAGQCDQLHPEICGQRNWQRAADGNGCPIWRPVSGPGGCPPDIPPDEWGCGPQAGQHCTENGGECGDTSTCLLMSGTKGGICTCQCTADDPSTALVNEDDCPDLDNQICGTVRLGNGDEAGFCFRRCQPRLGANDCPAPFACGLPSQDVVPRPLDQAICLSFGCVTDDDCPVTTGASCKTDAAPGSSGACPAGQTCLPILAGFPAGVCAEPGNCDIASGLCADHASDKPNAAVGDPCSSDRQCGVWMTCELQLDRQLTLGQKDHGAACTHDDDCCGSCDTGSHTCRETCVLHARNGYCVIEGCSFATASAYAEFACPAGSTCNRLHPGGRCMKTCTLGYAASCRGRAGDQDWDYECRAWNNLAVLAVMIADEPFCDFGDAVPCDIFGPGTALDCSALGEQGNPTNMVCRDPASGQKMATPKNPSGLCLDDTTSGP